jgi:hypothetical protein
MVAAGWTEAQKRAYVLADNQLAITGSGWDPELLRLELGELNAMRSTHRETWCSAAVQAPAIGPRAAPPCGPHCEIRPGENAILQYLSHDGRPAPAVRAAATVRPAATASSPTAKSLSLAPPAQRRISLGSGKKTATLYRVAAPADPVLVRGNRLGGAKGPQPGPPSLRRAAMTRAGSGGGLAGDKGGGRSHGFN